MILRLQQGQGKHLPAYGEWSTCPDIAMVIPAPSVIQHICVVFKERATPKDWVTWWFPRQVMSVRSVR